LVIFSLGGGGEVKNSETDVFTGRRSRLEDVGPPSPFVNAEGSCHKPLFESLRVHYLHYCVTLQIMLFSNYLRIIPETGTSMPPGNTAPGPSIFCYCLGTEIIGLVSLCRHSAHTFLHYFGWVMIIFHVCQDNLVGRSFLVHLESIPAKTAFQCMQWTFASLIARVVHHVSQPRLWLLTGTTFGACFMLLAQHSEGRGQLQHLKVDSCLRIWEGNADKRERKETY